jgi:hypothetical protein
MLQVGETHTKKKVAAMELEMKKMTFIRVMLQ